jgi:aspartyl-tRNA(Asn)/glutamyl-tRNA(Gln) amidotransferase subunit C
MPIGASAVEKVFYLARITPKGGEIEKFSTQLDAVLEYMDKLNEINTEDVEPVGNITDLSNVLREDTMRASSKVKEVLKNAPSDDGESFTVPKVF